MFDWLGSHFFHASILSLYRTCFIGAELSRYLQINTHTHTHKWICILPGLEHTTRCTSHHKPPQPAAERCHSALRHAVSLRHTARRLSVAVSACSYKRLGAGAEGPCNNKLLIEGLQWAREVLAGRPAAERSPQHAGQPRRWKSLLHLASVPGLCVNEKTHSHTLLPGRNIRLYVWAGLLDTHTDGQTGRNCGSVSLQCTQQNSF